MSDEPKNIPGKDDKEQERLLDYLHHNLSDESQHAFERNMEEDEFMSDAVEGLQEIKNQQHLQSLVQRLNNDLKKQISKKKKRKSQRKINEQPWVYFTIILLLLLIIIAFIVIKRFA